MSNPPISTSGSAFAGFVESRLRATVAFLVLCFPFRTTFVGIFLAPTILRVVSALSTAPTVNRILVLVLVLVQSLLSVLSLFPFAFALAVLALVLLALAFAKRTNVHRVVSSWV